MNQTSENLPKKRKGPLPFSGERAVVVRYAFRPLRPFPARKPIEVVAEGIPRNHHDGMIVSEVRASVKLLRIVYRKTISICGEMLQHPLFEHLLWRCKD